MQGNELWDKEFNHSISSWVLPSKLKGDGYAESHTASLYGHETYYQPRDYSPSPSQMSMMYPPPGYQSGPNTPQSQFARTVPMIPDVTACCINRHHPDRQPTISTCPCLSQGVHPGLHLVHRLMPSLNVRCKICSGLQTSIR